MIGGMKYLLSVFISTLLGLVLSQPVLAYDESDLRTFRALNRCVSCDLSGADLSGINLYGATLSEADLSGTNLRRTNLIDADLSGAGIRGTQLSGADLTNADLSNADFSGTDLEGVNLTGANLDKAILDDVQNLRGAKLEQANLSWVYLNSVDLSGTDLIGTNLSGAVLGDANLSETNLSEANLSGAILANSNLSGANLAGADLSATYLYGTKLVNTDLTNANLDGARFSDADLTGANLTGANLTIGKSNWNTLPINKTGITIKEYGRYPEITSFDLHGTLIYMTSKVGKLYRTKNGRPSLFGDYVRNYPDLLVAFKKRGGNKTIEAWGKWHWENHGKNNEARSLPVHSFEVVLDLSKDPAFESPQEVGLLSVVSNSDYVYVSYTVYEAGTGRKFLKIEEYTHQLEKVRVVAKIRTDRTAHVAGTLVFDALGKLYVSVGEGGVGDKQSQDLSSLLGKILRIDVSQTNAEPEIIAYGLRNPWKISIDSKNRMFIGDCGEATIESVYLLDDLYPNTPYNLGWPVFEGTKRVWDDPLRFEDTLAPIYEYRHHGEVGACVIGGYFLDDLGVYIFGDYLGKIANKYNCKAKDIMTWNDKKNTNIRIGEKLKIYVNADYE